MNPNPIQPNDHGDDDIRRALSAFVAGSEPTDEFVDRLSRNAHKAYVSRPASPWLRRWRPIAAVAGTCAVVLLATALTLTPSKAMAKTFALVQTAVDQVKTLQLIIDSHSGAKDEKVSVVAANGRFAVRTTEGQLFKLDRNSIEAYDPKANQVTEIDLWGTVDGQDLLDKIQQGISEGLKQIDLKKMLADFRKEYGDQNISVSPITNVDGRDVYYVTAQAPDKPERIHMTVDAASDLPREIIVDKQTDGSWSNEATIEVKFNEAVAPELLNMQFPADAKHVKFDPGELMKGLNPKKEIP